VDVLAMQKLMAWVGLASTQQDLEKFIVEAVANGVDVDKLRALFSPHLDGLDPELLAGVRIARPLVPAALGFLAAMPTLRGSNNWAVAASRSATGAALQCNDPHLEVNRLPAIWYEMVGRLPDDYRIGVTVPGTPGLVMGRSRALSGGFTYGFMDQVDLFVEQVVDGSVIRGETREAVQHRVETVKRRGGASIDVDIWETSAGLLEVDGPLEDGQVLAVAVALRSDGAAESLAALIELWRSAGVEQATAAASRMALSANWLFADRDGRIAYQQSGKLPLRSHSGLHPVGAAHAWTGFAEPSTLLTQLDPECGWLATANEDRGQPGVNAPMAPHRADRIGVLLEAAETLDLNAMFGIQRDLYSRHAEPFMELIRPHLGDGELDAMLAAWDLRYDVSSKGATFFERIYASVLAEVFGGMFGRITWKMLCEQTGVVTDYYGYFDRILLGADDPAWFGDGGRGAVIERALDRARARGDVEAWGVVNRVVMSNLFWNGRLAFLGADVGPMALPGGRGTIVQAQMYENHGRATSFAPSWRYMCDLGEDEAHTSLAGGASGRVLNRYYKSGLKDWRAFRYKTLSAAE
jgi:penicillin amidase